MYIRLVLKPCALGNWRCLGASLALWTVAGGSRYFWGQRSQTWMFTGLRKIPSHLATFIILGGLLISCIVSGPIPLSSIWMKYCRNLAWTYHLPDEAFDLWSDAMDHLVEVDEQQKFAWGDLWALGRGLPRARSGSGDLAFLHIQPDMQHQECTPVYATWYATEVYIHSSFYLLPCIIWYSMPST